MSMKLMSLDTLALQRELISNGLEMDRANEIASALTKTMRVSELQVATKNDLALLQASMIKLLEAAETERLILSDLMQALTETVVLKRFNEKVAFMLFIALSSTFVLASYAYYLASNAGGV